MPCWFGALLVGTLCVLTCAWPTVGQAADRGADGHFDKRTSSHFVLYQDVDIDRTSGFRGSRRFEQQVLDVLEAAYQQIDVHLGLRPERPITVIVYDPSVFDAQFSGLFRFPAAGFYGGRVHIRGDSVVSDRLVRVLHHELVHASFDAEARSLVLPAWLNEGVAEWLEARAAGQRGLSNRQRAFLEPVAQAGQLFSLADMSTPSFGHLGPQGARLAYLQSFAFIEYLTRSHGERSLRGWIGEILRTGDLDRSARRSFRADLASLEASFRQDLVGRPR
jgi:hypothetical protein